MTASPDDLLVDADEAAIRPPDPTPNFAFDDSPGVPFDDDGTGPVRQPQHEASAPSSPPPEPDPAMEPQEFDERHREPFQGLIYVGQLTDSFTLWGHSFRIMTPSQIERLCIGPLHAKYQNTITSEMAFETILVAAYLQSIDGEPLPQPVLNGPKDAALQDRYDWVLSNVQRQVISKIYEKCLILEEKVDNVLAAMGEAPG